MGFATDIRPMFREVDVRHMQPHGYDLSNYVDVKQKAAAIYQAVANGSMPPGPEDRWTPQMLETFKAWMDAGCPE